VIDPSPAALGKQLRRLTTLAIEQIQDPQLLNDPALETTVEIIVDRLCLSLKLSKPVGLATWATREARRRGIGRAHEIAEAAACVVAADLMRLRNDQSRALTYLQTLRAEIDGAFAGLDEEPADKIPQHDESVAALLAMLAECDALTCCHSKATGEWARRLCAALRLSSEMTEFIVLCALLHDVGKVSTPEHILLKRGELDADEWQIMREHSASGQRILSQLPSLARCAAIVRAHHERWDGTGYPDRLHADAIPFEARVVAVADAFHAMISDRPYRKAIAPRRAMEILREGRGTQWDPLVVDAMLGMLGGRREAQSARAETSSA
jgi:putative nucleotidyltransferase with HDIG domain